MNEIVIFAVGLLLGIGLVLLFIAYETKTLLKKLDSTVEKTLESMFMGVIVEKHGLVYRVYSEKDAKFICQGETVEEIKEAFSKDYPNKVCYITGGDDEVVKELQEALKKK